MTVALTVIHNKVSAIGDGADTTLIRPSDWNDDHTVNGVSQINTELAGKAATTTTVTAGAGLTGGGDLSANRTIDVGAGAGISVAADAVALDTAHARNVDHAGVSITAGNGLSGGGDISTTRTLTVNQGFAYSWTVAHTFQAGLIATEIVSPSNPAANNLHIFAKDVATITHLFTRDSAGTEVDLSLVASAAPQARTLTAGAGMTGGGTLASDRTFDVIGSTSIIVGADDVQRAALTGDVTAAQNVNATTIAADVVDNTKLANMVQATIKGRASGAGTGDPTDLSGAQVLTIAGAQAADATLSALAAYNSNGLLTQTAADTFAARTIAATATQITVTNGDGVGGNPTLSFPADIIVPTVLTVPNVGLHLLDTNATHDLIVKPGSDLTADRTLTITTGDANRTLTLVGDVTTSGTHSGTNTGDQTITLTGDVTGSGTGSFATAIANNVVTNADLADVGTATIKGRVTASTGDPEDLTGTQATTLLDVFTPTLKGLAPLSGGGTANYLRADGQWQPPPGAGGGAPSSAAYVTLAADGTLSAERTLAVGAGLVLTDAGANLSVTLGLHGTDIAVPAIITVPNTGLHLLDTNATHDLIVKPGSDLTLDRTFTLTTGDANRTLTINADTTLGGGTHSGTNTGDQTLAGLGGVATTVTFTAGAGLTGGGDHSTNRTFDVGGSTSIIVGTDDVQRAALTGDVTAAQNVNATAIAADVVTNAKLANVNSATFKGRITAAAGDPEDLTGTQATTLLDVFTSTLKGLVPSGSGGSTVNYLRGDGTWQPPPGAGAQPLDATLTALAALDTTAGVLAQTGTDTFAKRTITGTANQIAVANGTGASANPTLSLDATDIIVPAILTVPNSGLHILDTNATHDLIIKPGSDLTLDRILTVTTGDAARTLTFTADATIGGTTSGTNTGDQTLGGLGGQPLDATLTALAALDTTAGVLAQTGTDTFAKRTLTGTANQIAVANGTGASANPTLSLDATDIIVPAIITAPNSGLHILDTNASHDLIIKPGSDLTLDRIFTLTTGDAARTLTINADTTLGGGTHSGTNTGDQTLPTLSSLGGVSTGRIITSGGGLTGGGDLSADRTLAVGAGTGITVNADDVAINLAAALTWTGATNFSNATASTSYQTGALILGNGGLGVFGNINAGGTILSYGAHGYATGGAVVQATSKTTAVTLNTYCGKITTHAASLAGNTSAQFQFNNSVLKSADALLMVQCNTGSMGSYAFTGVCWADGNATVTIRNITSGALAENVDILFAVFKMPFA